MNSTATLQLQDHTVVLVDRPATGEPAATPLVLLHGGAVDHRMWSPQLAAFDERRLVVPDARGHGGSSDATTPYRLADDVVALLDALEIDRAVLAGVSMGGGTAVDVALEHPDRCAALVVSGTGTSEPTFTDPWTVQAFADWSHAAEVGDAEAWVEVFMRFTYGPVRSVEDVDSEVAQLVRAMAIDTLSHHVTLDDEGRPVPPVPPTPVTRTWERAPGIEVPVLVVAGADDGPDHQVNQRRLAETVPDGRLVELPGAHYPNLEAPDAFERVVGDFLRSRGL